MARVPLMQSLARALKNKSKCFSSITTGEISFGASPGRSESSSRVTAPPQVCRRIKLTIQEISEVFNLSRFTRVNLN